MNHDEDEALAAEKAAYEQRALERLEVRRERFTRAALGNESIQALISRGLTTKALQESTPFVRYHFTHAIVILPFGFWGYRHAYQLSEMHGFFNFPGEGPREAPVTPGDKIHPTQPTIFPRPSYALIKVAREKARQLAQLQEPIVIIRGETDHEDTETTSTEADE